MPTIKMLVATANCIVQPAMTCSTLVAIQPKRV